jgi:hypothetical protein
VSLCLTAAAGRTGGRASQGAPAIIVIFNNHAHRKWLKSAPCPKYRASSEASRRRAAALMVVMPGELRLAEGSNDHQTVV